MPATALLKLQTGPVQDSLAQVRTARDLWGASWLLSHLTQTAALKVKDTPGAELLAPVWDGAGDPLEATMPNFFLARVPSAGAGEIARSAEEAIRTEWKRITGAVHELLSKHAPPGWDKDWEGQLARFPEVNWIVHPCPSDAEARRLLAEGEPPLPENPPDYQKPGVCLDALHVAHAQWKLNARRNSRTFAAWQGSPVPKDPLDGFREILGDPGDATFWETLRQSRLLEPTPGGWEGYGALTLVKRLFPEAYLRDHLDWQPFSPAFDSIQHLTAAIDPANGKLPPGSPACYAILMLDGDDLGKWACGCMGTHENLQPLQPGYSFELSRRLKDFSARASGIVDQYVGQAIYCGGDDVLAILPGASALGCADELARAFSQALPGATASAGIALAHVRAPLSATIRAARAARDAAKSLPGKDAFSLRILQRSGTQLDLTIRWRSGAVKVWRELEERKRVLKPRFAQFLAERLRRLLSSRAPGNEEGWAGEWTDALREAALLELTCSLIHETGVPRQEAAALAQSWHSVLARLSPRAYLRFWLAWAFLRRVDDALDLPSLHDA